MARTVQIREFGGPEKMEIVDLTVGDPGPGQIRIRQEACGLNFIDIYQRSGVYKLELPHALGMEGAGVVEAVGEGVAHLKPGDRVAYAANPPGSYSEARVMPAMTVCRLPDSISFETGAAMMLKGLTTQYLFRSTRAAEGRRDRAVPCRRRRGRTDRLPVGAGDGRAPDRDGRLGREMPAGAGSRRGRVHQLRDRGLRRPREGAYGTDRVWMSSWTRSARRPGKAR